MRLDDRRDDSRLRRLDGDRRFAGFDNIRRLNGFGDCPPGLARKGNGCLPPGQAKKLVGAALPVALGSRLLDGPYRQWYRDDARYYYRNDGDYIYRVNRQGGLVDALFPFQDRDFSYYDVGTAYPAADNFYNVPQQYQSYYADGNDYTYRYGDGAIYQVNRSDNVISSDRGAARGRPRGRPAVAGRLWRLQRADGLSRPLLRYARSALPLTMTAISTRPIPRDPARHRQ